MSKKLKSKPAGVSQPLALQYVEEAFAVVLEIMRDTTAAQPTRLRAAAVVIERAWGRVGAAVKAAAGAAPLLGSMAVNRPSGEWTGGLGQPRPSRTG